ncbi:MAG: hypothetical protein L0Y56_20180 [Nitrospira sp.]|nr:hypothetical protein [Nitrospira sp.]
MKKSRIATAKNPEMEYQKWRHSARGVWEELSVIPLAVTDEDQKVKTLIVKTLLKLPHKVRNKVLDEVTFVALNTEGSHGVFDLLYCPPHEKEKYEPMIFLNFNGFRRKTESFKLTVIAHEIAHFILNHGNEPGPTQEKDADDFCEKWGFGRAYKKY